MSSSPMGLLSFANRSPARADQTVSMKLSVASLLVSAGLLMTAVCGDDVVQAKAGYGGCPDACGAQVEPLCAISYGYRKTFNNDCELQRFNCRNDQNYVKVSNCPCIP